jgi:NADH-quinone oxidoreductase subunit G
LVDLPRLVGRARPKLPFDSLAELRANLCADDPRFAEAGLLRFDWAPPTLDAVAIPTGTELSYPIQDFYLTNPIARASPTLQRCSAEILHGQDYLEAAE